MRHHLAVKPTVPDPSSGNTELLQIGKDTVYVTESQYRSLMRQTHFSFFLIGLAALSIMLAPALTRILRF
jgi:hypothetical protein